MNKQSNPITWALALAFVTLASIQIGAGPRVQTRMTAPAAQQQKPATKTATSYACPMHPEVKSTRKGKCPKCKMDLQLVRETTSSVDQEKLVASAEIVSADVPGNVLAPRKKMTIPDDLLSEKPRYEEFNKELVRRLCEETGIENK